MSSEWQSAKIEFNSLKSICLLIADCPHSTPVWTDQGVVVLRNQNIKNGRLDLSSPSFTDEENFIKRTKRAQPSFGDIVITREAPMGEVCAIPKGLKCCLGQRQVLLRPDPIKVDSRYLLFALQSPFVQHQIGWNEGTGSTVSNLRIPVLEDLKIPTPDLDVQRDIADTLSALDDRIALLRETNATLEAIAQALFKSWFVDFDPVHANAGTQAPSLPADIQALFPSRLVESPQGLIPEGWEVFRLGDVTERITKGTTPTTLKKAFTEEGINFVKVESLTENGEFINEKFSYIDEETHQLLKRSQLKPGDVLVTIAGTIGRVAEVTEDIIPANTNQAVALIRPIQQKLPSGLIRRFLQRNDSKQHMGERVVQAVQANLSLGSLSDMAVVVPPEAVVGKLYALAFEHIDTSKNNNMRQIKTLTNLRDTLLPRLISGQLRLPEAEAALAEVI